jgi:hypothetical protein
MLINRKITLENINIPEVKSVKIKKKKSQNKMIVYVMKFNYNHVLGMAKLCTTQGGINNFSFLISC